ncbi:TULIP family P47-like protein [Bacillus sp. SCS-151]|uniref:TULIP family P47-like protein n=1 Tax=Nanhaiella sioensis TaxID=3115293 RepID=UPI00397D48F0
MALESTIDLFGWDTVYATSYKDANDAIRKMNTTPRSFSFESINPTLGTATASINGAFNSWEISTNSDGQNLVLRCPVPNCTFISILESNPLILNDGWLDVEVKLNFIEQEERTYLDHYAEINSGSEHHLKISASESVSIQSAHFDFSNADDPLMAEALCKQLFLQAFQEDLLGAFEHVFSIFIINQKAQNDDFQWLKATDLHYALASSNESTDNDANLRNSVLGVLAMTESRPRPGDAHLVDARMVPASGGQSSFGIDATRFVEKWLLPGILAMNLGSTRYDYDLDSDGLGFTNNKRLYWDSFADDEGELYHAYIDVGNFHMSLINSQIRLEITDLYWEINDDVTAHVDFIQYYTVSLASGIDSDEEHYSNVLQLDQVGDPTCNLRYTEKDKGWTDILKDTAVMLAIGIAGVSLGGLLDIAAAAGEAAEAGGEAVGEAAETGSKSISETVDNVKQEVDEGIDMNKIGDEGVEGEGSFKLPVPEFSDEAGEAAKAEVESSGSQAAADELSTMGDDMNTMSEGEGDMNTVSEGEGDMNTVPEGEDDMNTMDEDDMNEEEEKNDEEKKENNEENAKEMASQKKQSFAERLAAKKYKMLFGFLGGIGGFAYQEAPKIQNYMDEQKWSKFPTLDEFGQNCVSGVHWPSTNGFQLQAASLHNCLLLGGKLVEDDDFLPDDFQLGVD